MSVRTKQLGPSCTDCLEIWYLRACRNLAKKIQVSLKCDDNDGHVTWRPLYIIIIIFFFRYRRVAIVSWGVHDLFFLCTFMIMYLFFSKIVPFMRQCGRNTKYIVEFPLQQWLRERSTILRKRTLSVVLVISVAQSSQKVPYTWSCPSVSRQSFWRMERSCVT
jgi:hypothetical protein